MNAILEGIGLSKTFKGEVPVRALRNVNIVIEPQTMVAIMGPSGSGKSTLLHILGALERPDEGRVLLEGEDLAKLSNDQLTIVRRNRIGFIFQQFNLLPSFTVAENVAFPLRLGGSGSADAAKRAAEVLAKLGLQDKHDRLPSQLSGGEQQRVAIARALVTRPALILADEPTGNLDRKTGLDVVSQLRELVDTMQQTVVLVTHDAAIAAYADQIHHMQDGTVTDEATEVERIAQKFHSQELQQR